MLYKSESPDLQYYLKIIKPPNFENVTQEELYKIKEGFYKKFYDEWLQEKPTIIRSLQLPRFSYMPELYLKFLLHPETIKTDWKVLEKKSTSKLHEKIKQIVKESKIYFEIDEKQYINKEPVPCYM